MTEARTNCDICSACIATKTKIDCEGFCMPCYMQNNYGFKPSQIKSIKRRGLYKVAVNWSNLVSQGQPNICLLYTSPSPRDRG